jgi:hypothetical protein
MTAINRQQESVQRPKNGGFALVIALSLMAFVLLLLLGLTTMVTVSTRSAQQSLQQQAARSNAQLALMLAIGDLQKFVGPDQRVTATADIAAGADGSRIDAGAAPQNNESIDLTLKGLSSVQPGTRYWTGVFENRDDPEDIYQKTPSVRHTRWLVSGQNDASSSINPADTTFSVGANGKASNPTEAMVLVGPNSAGDDVGAEDRYVAAPRVIITDASSGNAPSGAFAYWVGDEGVKARINLEQSKTDSDYASLVAQRRGWETVVGFDEYPLPGSDEKLPRVYGLSNLTSLVPSVDEGSIQSVFHAGTTVSQGLLTNTLEGGMQVDLSALLSGTLPGSAPADSYPNYPISGGRLVEQSAFPNLQYLTWNHVQDFYQTGTQLTGDLQVSAAGNTTNTIAPTITDLRLLFGVRLSNAVMEPDSTDVYTANVHLVAKIAVTLSNPYSVALEWGQPLELEIKSNKADDNQTLTVYSDNGSGKVKSFEVYDTHYLPRTTSGGERNPDSRAAVLNRAMFQIPAGRLEPGQAIAYSHAGSRIRNKSAPVVELIVEMEPIDVTLLEYGKSLEMTLGSYSFPRGGLAIRAAETSRIIVELRKENSGEVLRRITNLELNNPYRRDTESQEFDVAKVFDSDGIQKFNGAVPLLLYKFQLSQPGEEYEGYDSFEMGLLGSTLRTYADFNLRATDFHSPIASYNPPPYFMEIIDSKSSLDWYNDNGGETGSAFTANLEYIDPSQFWGYNQTDGTKQVVLYSFPSQFVSLAQFQHADMSQDAVTRSIGHQPGNAFGNSYATLFVQRNETRQVRTDHDLESYSAGPSSRSYYDISYILNSAIWDRYFFSSISTGETNSKNPSLISREGFDADYLNDPNLAAIGLLVDGSFNVNSTQKEAWKAFLGSSKHFRHPTDTGGEVTTAFPRGLQQPQGFQEIPSGKSADSYAGYRRLLDAELDAFAEAMVRQVRLRGPFVSRSHFMNRTLADISNQSELSYSGPLQTALDESGINMNIEGVLNQFSELNTTDDRARLRGTAQGPAVDIPDIGKTDPYSALDLGVASIVADTEMLVGSGDAILAREQGYRSTGIPGWVTQADVLQVIGPAVSARSDTFRIRTAGQSLDLSGEVQGTAYLEAVVQRMPDYVDATNAANERDTADSINLTQTNQNYGRKFEILSIRWLSTNEI